MKLKEFSIMHYGPLPNTGRISLRNFNLFWGKNEDGKTLTIDALVKLLLGRNTKDFEHIDRVEEKPEGYVIIEDDKGKEVKLPEKGDLTKVTDSNLTPSECRNIFVIRNSDLSIAREREGESKFYTNVTNRLTGLRTEEISKAEKTLREIGKITPTGEFRDDIKEEKLKKRVEDAGKLIGGIEDLAKKIQEERFDQLEEESVELKEDIERIEQKIKNLDDARRRGEYEKGRGALDELTSALKKIRSLEIYNESDKQLWKDCEKEIKDYGEWKEQYLAELRKIEGQLQETSGRVREVEREFRIFEGMKKRLDDEVKPDLRNYEMELGKVKSEETKNRFYTVAAVTSAVLLLISILAVVLSPSPVFYGLLVFFLASTIVFAGLRFSFAQKKAHLAGVFARIRVNISKFELEAESPGKLYSNIEKFEGEYQKKSEQLQSMGTEEGKLGDRIKKLKEEMSKTAKNIEDAEAKIQGIKTKSKEESLGKYAEKLEMKEGLETVIREQKSVLKSRFGEKGKELEESISHWNEEVQKLEEYKDKAKDMTYSEADKSTLGEERGKREKRLQEVNDMIASFRKELKEIEREADGILKLREPLYCEASVDLKVIRDELQSFIDKNEINRDNAKRAIEIFEEIEREEEAKVSELFGSEDPISKYFNEITNGLYEEVFLDQETMKIQVKRRDGKILTAEKLSGGAYDQLYLSIRLALGEKLLKGKKGFFIMDDPFIKADPDRLQRQIQTLKKISELGWQVIYFSAKGEIRDALEEDIKLDVINYVEVQGIFS
jgi:DNA repair protein SbcC/Rad50